MKLKGYRGEIYFHVIASKDRTLRYSDQKVVEPGKELKARDREFILGTRKAPRKRPEPCVFGMHASKYASGAFAFVEPHNGSWVCLVRLNTRVSHGDMKSVAMRRKVVAMRQVKSRHSVRFLTSRGVADWVLADPYLGVK